MELELSTKKKAPRLHVPSKRSSELELSPPEPPKREPVVLDMSRASTIPTIHFLMTDAQAVLGNELVRLRGDSEKKALTADQSLKFARYVRSLVDLAREDREQQALDELSRMTDEDLLALLLQSPEVVDRLRGVLANRQIEEKPKTGETK